MVMGKMAKLLWVAAVLAAQIMGSAPCRAAEKLSLHLGGYSKWWLVGAWQTSNKLDVGNVDIKGDSEIHVRGQTRLDNGLTVGVHTELEAGGATDQQTDSIDKAYAWVEGGWGKLELGSDYNAASLLHVAAPEAAGLWNGPSNGVLSDTVIARPAAVSTMFSGNQTELDHDDNAEKVLYFTPSLAGITLGISYTPSSQSEDNRGVTRNAEFLAAGLLVERKLGDVGVTASLGYGRGVLDADGATTHDKVQALSAGVQLSVGPVTLGGSVGAEHHSYPGRVATASGTDHSGRSFDLGVMVSDGPLSVSLDHYRSAVRGSATLPGDDRVVVSQLSAKRMLGPGVALMGALAHIAYDDEASAADSRDGYAVMSGLGLWF